ncbi:hypothetical protein GGS21DRAFT_515843 [Xylaria nigripes]|nr:hypothetical protein GGS21DRAFT_515843 [Xylaria nigripes]
MHMWVGVITTIMLVQRGVGEVSRACVARAPRAPFLPPFFFRFLGFLIFCGIVGTRGGMGSTARHFFSDRIV